MADQGHGLHVEFYIESVKQEFKSEEAGRPIHEDREFVRIHIPGDRNYSAEREATGSDKQRFALEYARFKNGLKDQEQAIGTPLIQWPAMTRSMAKDFSAVNVHTVEQLANLSDTSIQAFGLGGREWVTKAKAFLEVSNNSAAAQKYAAENEELKQRIALLEAQFAELSQKKTKDKAAA
ncbi:hypothetical protein [Bradyrhizobium genomosp. III]|uniref:hypothetical protein n=1 Tax=Bradyrhizobium genomosp. III TaxID=2683271 RepID=UPI0004B47C18|nr:hypothetical protein [Bradyrhizobium sp. CCBAU 15544]